MNIEDCIRNDRLTYRKGGEMIRRLTNASTVNIVKQTDVATTFDIDGKLGVVVTEDGYGVSYRFINLKTKQISSLRHNGALFALDYKRGTYNAL